MYIYLDNNSTTPCAPEVLAAMLPFFTEEYGNSASSHAMGRVAACAIAVARAQVADAIGARPESIIFTSGATESNNFALLGVANLQHTRRRVLVSAVEHKSVLGPAHHLRQFGFTVETLPVDEQGILDLNEARTLIDDKTLLVSVQAANNETGVIHPVREVVELAHDKGALCHCDAAQFLGKAFVNVEQTGVDIASFSAHKAYGPKGIGALFISPRIAKSVNPVFFGGHQERGLRPGTQNVPAIVGFGCACQILRDHLASDIARINLLREWLETDLIKAIPGALVHGVHAPRLPGTVSLAVPGVPADMLLANLSTICVGNGSACNTGALEPSHVLLAMKVSRAEADSTLRISLGRYTTESDVVAASREISDAAQYLRTQLNQPADQGFPTGG